MSSLAPIMEAPLLPWPDMPVRPPETEGLSYEQEIALRTGYDIFWEEFTNRVKFADNVEAYEKEVGFQKEVAYYSKFVAGVRTMAAEQPESIVTLLIDVDDNIGIVKEDVDEQDIKVLVRPAFVLAMDTLGRELPGRLELGLLTTKPQRTLNNEAISETYLASVDPTVVNPTYFMSSRSSEKEAPWLDQLGKRRVNWNDPKDPVLKAVDGVVSLDYARSMPVSSDGLPSWYDPKLVILNQIVNGAGIEQYGEEQYPSLSVVGKILEDPTEKQRAYVFVDDLPCAEVIKHPRLLGVCMADLKQDVLMRAMIPGSGITAIAA